MTNFTVGSLWYFGSQMYAKQDKFGSGFFVMQARKPFCILEVDRPDNTNLIGILKILSSDGKIGWLFITWMFDYKATRIPLDS